MTELKPTTFERSQILCLFDVDGTLTPSRMHITQDMKDLLKRVREKSSIAIVGGSNFVKQKEQLGDSVLDDFDYVFSENGLVSWRGIHQIHVQNFAKFFGEENLKKFINFCLHYIADLDIPLKRGHFVEFRSGMLNISPIGRDCSQQERLDFYEYDLKHKVREKMIRAIQNQFPDFKLKYSIGGQISFDVFPEGWDKTYCLQHIKNENFKEIHFFGDKTDPGGNDYEIFISDLVVGHSVSGPEETKKKLCELFNLN